MSAPWIITLVIGCIVYLYLLSFTAIKARRRFLKNHDCNGVYSRNKYGYTPPGYCDRESGHKVQSFAAGVVWPVTAVVAAARFSANSEARLERRRKREIAKKEHEAKLERVEEKLQTDIAKERAKQAKFNADQYRSLGIGP